MSTDSIIARQPGDPARCCVGCLRVLAHARSSALASMLGNRLAPGSAYPVGFLPIVRSAVAAAGGIIVDTSPPKPAISLTRLELM